MYCKVELKEPQSARAWSRAREAGTAVAGWPARSLNVDEVEKWVGMNDE